MSSGKNWDIELRESAATDCPPQMLRAAEDQIRRCLANRRRTRIKTTPFANSPEKYAVGVQANERRAEGY
jgi:hypothetical protein